MANKRFISNGIHLYLLGKSTLNLMPGTVELIVHEAIDTSIIWWQHTDWPCGNIKGCC